MQFFIGIDAGGTKTKIVMTDNELSIIKDGSAGPSNYLQVGHLKAAEFISDFIKQFIRTTDVRSPDIAAVCAGIAGTGRAEDRKNLKDEIHRLLNKKGIFSQSLEIVTDAAAALEGAHSGKPGCILIAGTGSILYGKKDNGKYFRCGGFGRIIGDEGGGSSIGRKAFSHLAKTIDGREPSSALSEMMKDNFQLKNEDDLINGIYKSNIDIASAAPVVFKAAELKDSNAIKIIDQETEELLKHVVVASSNFPGGKFKISLAGGLFEDESIYARKLKTKVQKTLPGILIKDQDYPPEIGAVLLSGLRNE